MAIETTLDRALHDASQGRLQEAIEAVRLTLRRSPTHPLAMRVMGQLYVQAGDFEQAIHHLRRAVAAHPRAADAQSNLANALMSAGRAHEAVAVYRKALELHPNFIPALIGLSGALTAAGDGAGALAAGELCAKLQPNQLDVDLNRVDALDVMDRHDRALALLDEITRRHRFDASVHARRLLLLNYQSAPPETLASALRDYGHCFTPPAPVKHFDRNSDRPLRIGILSPDLRTHSVAFFFDAPTRHIPADMQLVAFASSPSQPNDAMTNMFKDRITEWVEVSHLDDDALDAAIRARRIDVMLDLAGHSTGNRLRALDRRPAPLIVTAIGHPASTGHPAVDVRLVDSITDPPGSQDACTERLERMDPCFLCYIPPKDAPEPTPPAADAPLTFGSFNLSAKISAETLRLWRMAMDAVPGSRLLLKSRSLGDAATRESLHERMRAAGIDESRVELLAFVKGIDEHLALYSRIHVALDTTPYSGTTTTCEALWMGVPVVTLAGDRHSARVSASLLRAAGFDELVASSGEDFARIAARCATDAQWRAAFRRDARARMQASPLMDTRAYAERFFGALRASWRARCQVRG
jgi:predicted O-linked N-acetylglucosamine transferase (SPINDLY family)